MALIVGDDATGWRGRVVAIYVVLALMNVGAWGWAFAVFSDHSVMLGTALLAYTFGLRHAVDADHIAAIDNVTRKLMQDGKRPVSVGFFFSLGHSSMILVMSVLIAFAAAEIETRFDSLRAVGSLISTCISALFLFAIAAVNGVIFLSVWQRFRAVRQGAPLAEDDLDLLLSGRGLLARLFRPLFGMVRHSWHMFPLGLLFGFGFDTVTEVGLFGISAAQVSEGQSFWLILVFPALFTAGMSLVDSTDSLLMVGAYGWAFLKPVRKLFYNMTITLVSVIVALVIGGIEVLGLLTKHFKPQGAFWDLIGDLNEHWGILGYAIIGIFAASWLISILVYRLGDFDRIEVRSQ